MAESIADAWTRIVTWLRDNAPDELVPFQPAVSQDELDLAAEEFGLELPDDYQQLYRTVNGTDPNGESVGVFPAADEWDDMAFGPLALTHAINQWAMQNELLEMGEFDDCEPQSVDGVANDWWNPGWIPFASNGGGDFYCVDLAPAEGGVRGQVITHAHESGTHEILAPSLAAYIRQLADAVESGEFEYTAQGMQRTDSEA